MGESGGGGEVAELGGESGFGAGAGEDEGGSGGFFAKEGGVRGDEFAEAFFIVDAAQEENEGPAGERGKTRSEGDAASLGVGGRAGSAVAHHAFVDAVGEECVAGDAAFFVASEANAGCFAEDAGFAEEPVELLFEVFGRVVAAKPRIEHAVGKHEVGRAGAPEGAIDGPAALPEAVHEDGVEADVVGGEPGAESRGVVAANGMKSEGGSRLSRSGDEQRGRRCAGGVGGDDFDGVAEAEQGLGGAQNGFGRAA